MANYVQTNKCHRYSEACNIILCEYEALEGCAYYIYLGKYACINDIICRGKITNIDMILCHMFLTVFDISCQNVIAYGVIDCFHMICVSEIVQRSRYHDTH